MVLHGVQEAWGSWGLTVAVVLDAAGYGGESHPGDGELAHAAVDEVGYGDGDRDVVVAPIVVHEGARQAQHRGDMALRWKWNKNDGAAARGLGGGHAMAPFHGEAKAAIVCVVSKQKKGALLYLIYRDSHVLDVSRVFLPSFQGH